MRKVIRKAPLTLIEVCIALGLMSIIVYTLFSSLIQTVRVSKSLDVIKSKALNSSFFYNRLLHVLAHADPSSIKLETNDHDSLSKVDFSFENGLDPALIYSGLTEASILLDQNHDLILSIFSKDKLMVQSEILLSNIREFSITSVLPYFMTLNIMFSDEYSREFVFFFSNRPEDSEAYSV